MVNAVLFDLDGTLVDTAPDLGYALNQQRQMHGLPEMPLELIRPYASHGTVGLLQIGFAISPDHPAFQDLRAPEPVGEVVIFLRVPQGHRFREKVTEGKG